MASSLALHEALKPLSFLCGRWSTTGGAGKYPTISDFKYHEDLEFTCIGQPMYNFSSSSRHPEKQTPMHQERGFLRIKPGSLDLAFVVSHNFGLTSVEEGVYNPHTKEIVLESKEVSRISFAKPPRVTKVRRVIRYLNDEKLEITLFMETENTPLTEHLHAVYTKVEVIG